MHLPPILDVRDELRRALADASDSVDEEEAAQWTAGEDSPGTGFEIEDTEHDLGHYLDDSLADEYRAVVGNLEEFAERDDPDDGLLDEIDNQLLRVEEKVQDDDASREIHAIRERITVYRDDLGNPGANLVVEAAELRAPGGESADVGDLRGRTGEVWERVLDNGSGRTVGVTASFVGEWGDVLSEITGPTVELEPGETGTFEFEVAVPEDAVDWAVVPVEVA